MCEFEFFEVQEIMVNSVCAKDALDKEDIIISQVRWRKRRFISFSSPLSYSPFLEKSFHTPTHHFNFRVFFQQPPFFELSPSHSLCSKFAKSSLTDEYVEKYPLNIFALKRKLKGKKFLSPVYFSTAKGQPNLTPTIY